MITCAVRSAPGRSLIRSLIQLRPAPFTPVRPATPGAGSRRTRLPVNTGTQTWKACWGQPLASSNLASSAALTSHDVESWQPTSACLGSSCLSFWPRMVQLPASAVPPAGPAAAVVPGHGRAGLTGTDMRTPPNRAPVCSPSDAGQPPKIYFCLSSKRNPDSCECKRLLVTER